MESLSNTHSKLLQSKVCFLIPSILNSNPIFFFNVGVQQIRKKSKSGVTRVDGLFLRVLIVIMRVGGHVC